MEASLIASAILLGLAGAPHCTAMCAAPCTAAIGHGGRGAMVGFHLARVAGYAAAGGVAAASVGALALASGRVPVLHTLWTLLHAAALVLGLWLLWTGRQPAFLSQLGRVPQLAAAGSGWQRLRGPVRASAAGALWVAWPCGLLQSALMVAALAPAAASGAAVMAAFGVASSGGLWLAPWVWRRLGRSGSARAEKLAARAAGLMLVGMAAFALGHGLWHRVLEFCGLL